MRVLKFFCFSLLFCLGFCARSMADSPVVVFDMTTTDASGNLRDIANNRTGYLQASDSVLPVLSTSGPFPFLHFDGQGGYVMIDNEDLSKPSLLNARTFSVEVKFRIVNDNKPAGLYHREYIVGENSNCCDPSAEAGFALFASRVNGEDFRLAASLGVMDLGVPHQISIISKSSLQIDHWHTAELICDGESLLLYLDGVLEASTGLSGTAIQGVHPITLGRLAHSDWFRLFGDIAYLNISSGVSKRNEGYRAVNASSDISFDFDSIAGASVGTTYFNSRGRVAAQAVLNNGVVQNNGRKGGAIYLNDGSGTPSLSIARAPFSTAMGYSASFWFKPDDTNPRALWSEPGVLVTMQNNGIYASVQTNRSSANVNSQTVLRPGVWHLATVVASNDQLQLYVDGTLEASTALNGTIDRSTASTLLIGGAVTAGGNNYSGFKGSIDEVRAFGHALSTAEVRRLFRLGATSTALLSYEFDPERGALKNTGLAFSDLVVSLGAASSAQGGMYNGAGLFNGVGFGKTLSTANSTLFDNQFSFASWVKTDNTKTNHQYIVSNDRDVLDAAAPGGFSLRIDKTSRKVTAEIELADGSGKTVMNSTTALSANTWYHVALTFGNGALKLYVNGQLEQTLSLSPTVKMRTPSLNLSLGVLGYQLQYQLKGALDEVAMFDRVLSSQDVATLAAPYRIGTVPALSNKPIVTAADAWDAWPATAGLSLSAAPDEYEAASFLVEAGAGAVTVDQVLLPVGVNGSVRLVKVWYQGAGGNEYNFLNGVQKSESQTTEEADRMLRPELLLNNPNLVKVNTSAQNNEIMDSDGAYKERPRWPLDDASSLQPVTIPANGVQQFWVTAQAGSSDVSGQLMLSANSNPVTLPFSVNKGNRVALPAPQVEYQIYYIGYIDDACNGSFNDLDCQVNSQQKTDAQYLAEMRNLHTHGVDTPTMFAWGRYDQSNPFTYIDREMFLRQLAGINSTHIMYSGFNWFQIDAVLKACMVENSDHTWTSTANTPACQSALSTFKNKLDSLLTYFSLSGYPTPLIYGVDEAYGSKLIASIPLYEAIHDRGAKSIAAAYPDYYSTLENAQPGTNAGALIDYPVINQCDGAADCQTTLDSLPPSVTPMFYSNPQGEIEHPFTYRHNYGLWAWAKGMKGVAPWAYQSGFGNTWYDFDRTPTQPGKPPMPWFRDSVFTYPTATDVIDTIQWEGFREGIDDVRYLTRLTSQLAWASAHGYGSLADVQDAQTYLNALRPRLLAHVIDELEMDGIRLQLNAFSARLASAGINY